ncbi:MAG: hypothetical protein IID41_16010 [Planctomycetes bacterium]|nr:hypothetical protein [Planctomycetota bacterium]
MMITLITMMLGWATIFVIDTPLQRFMDRLAEDQAISADVRKFVLTQWRQCEDCDGESFLIEALTLTSKAFLSALDAYDADDMRGCAQQMGKLTSDENLYIATNAGVYQAKAQVAMNDIVEAAKTIDRLLSDAGKNVTHYTYYKAEVDFLRVYCLVQDLQFAAAQQELSAFIERHPNARQRLIVSAKQMLLELRNRKAGEIGEVTDLMKFAANRLRHGDAGKIVQERQASAVKLLDKMIEDAQEQENNSQNSAGGGGSSGGGRSPNTPLPRSQLPGGQAKKGVFSEAKRANPGESWGAMPPAQREEILQALQDRFPRRYRRLVEQYYEQLAKER